MLSYLLSCAILTGVLLWCAYPRADRYPVHLDYVELYTKVVSEDGQPWLYRGVFAHVATLGPTLHYVKCLDLQGPHPAFYQNVVRHFGELQLVHEVDLTRSRLRRARGWYDQLHRTRQAQVAREAAAAFQRADVLQAQLTFPVQLCNQGQLQAALHLHLASAS